mgnify:CR=1 FL=1
MSEQRRCQECGLVLSRYNPTLLCAPCGEKSEDLVTVARRSPRRVAREQWDQQIERVMVLTPTNAALGDRICDLRTRAGWTQHQLAYRAGLGVTVVSNAEYGRNQPTARSLFALALAFGVSMDELYCGGGRESGEKDAATVVDTAAGRACGAGDVRADSRGGD